MRRLKNPGTPPPAPAQDPEPEPLEDPAPPAPAARPRKAPAVPAAAPTTQIPHDPVNEQVLIAAAAIDTETRGRLLKLVTPDKFQVAEHVEAWLAFAELERRGLDFDIATVRQLVGDKVDVGYLLDLAADRDQVPTNLMHHVKMLEWDATRIAAVRGPLAGLLESLSDPTVPPERVRALAGSLQQTLSGGASLELVRDANALTREAMAQVRLRRQQACYPFGIDGLDKDEHGNWRLIPGCAPGKVTVVTGLSGGGKSTFVARVLLAQYRMKRRVGMGAWEMGDAPSLELLAVLSLGWSRYKMSVADYTDDEEQLLHDEMDRIGQYIKFITPPSVPPSNVKARGSTAGNDRALDLIESVLSEMHFDLFVGDLWKRLLREIEPDQEELALVRQQMIADRTKTHCILLQQQRLKDVEGRADKRPTREGIKGSGAWTEVADTILGVHRPALWKAVDDVIIEIDILKQRWGKWPLAVEFDWNPEYATILNGREVKYDQSGSDFAGKGGGSSFLGDDEPAPKRKGKKRG